MSTLGVTKWLDHVPELPNMVSGRIVFANEEMGRLGRRNIQINHEEGQKKATYSVFRKVKDVAVIAGFKITSKVRSGFPDNLREMRVHRVIRVVRS
jgi:hypothetical protein